METSTIENLDKNTFIPTDKEENNFQEPSENVEIESEIFA